MSSEHSRLRRAATPVLFAAGLLSAATAHAQTADPRDSLPVHAGSYALEGGVGANSTNLGVLRFFSPRSALGANISASYSHQSGDNSSFTANGVNVNLGYRHYGALRDRVAGFGTIGVTGGYLHDEQTQNQLNEVYTSSTTGGNIGAFGELGATYLVARRLTVNASAQASAVRSFSRETNGPSSGGLGSSSLRQNGYGASLGPVRVGVTLFF